MAKKPRSEGGLNALVQQKYETLPENQRKAADYLLAHLREAPFLSIVELEKRSGASKATIVRLAQRLGFSGFLELRGHLLEDVQSQMRITEMFPLHTHHAREETLTSVARQDVKNINQTIQHVDRRTFTEVAQMILKAEHVYTMGLGISSLMSRVLAYSLSQVAVRCTPFTHDHETFIEQIHLLGKPDLLIAFSFPPYSRETIEVVRVAKSRKVPVVAVTDKLTSPMGILADRVLPIASQNMLFTNSFSAISVIINALTTEVALRNRAVATRNLKESEQLLEEAGHYYTV